MADETHVDDLLAARLAVIEQEQRHASMVTDFQVGALGVALSAALLVSMTETSRADTPAWWFIGVGTVVVLVFTLVQGARVGGVGKKLATCRARVAVLERNEELAERRERVRIEPPHRQRRWPWR